MRRTCCHREALNQRQIKSNRSLLDITVSASHLNDIGIPVDKCQSYRGGLRFRMGPESPLFVDRRSWVKFPIVFGTESGYNVPGRLGKPP